MRFRASLAVVTLAVASLLAPASGLAQERTPPSDKHNWVEPPKDLPKAQRGDPTKNLDFLFGALKVAPDTTTAKAIEQRIWSLWMISKSDTANLLMSRARIAAEARDNDLAIRLLTSIIAIRPDFVEAWNRRATLYFMKKDYGASLADISQVLRREPRHFGALAGLGLILQEIGDNRRALDAYRKAIEVYPRLENIPEQVDKLREKVEGRDI